VAKRLDSLRCHLVWSRPCFRRLCVRWGPSYLQKKRHSHPTQFLARLLWPNGWMDDRGTWYGSRLRHRPHCIRRGPSCPRKGHSSPPPLFIHVYSGHGRPSQLLLSSCRPKLTSNALSLYFLWLPCVAGAYITFCSCGYFLLLLRVMAALCNRTGHCIFALRFLLFLLMVALWNRADHYIFALWLLLSSLWPPYVIGGPLYFCPVVSFFFYLLLLSSFFFLA